MSIRLTNTMTGKKETFTPSDSRVTMYVCGMTPKFDPHLGHAKLFVTIDVIRRYLEARGYDVRYVQNFTDVDDKIIARSQREGIGPADVAAKYTASYFTSMEALNVMPAEVYPKATETIPEIIEMIDGLVKSNHAYPAGNGDVFYSVPSFPTYGKLSHRTSDDVMAGARIQVEPYKRDPRDFALWKSAKPGEPSWESPWGPGRPGWHIECSAMVRKWLGDQIDIHGGGPDLIFPHHENEIAQSEAFTHVEPFVRYWVHIGQLNVDNEKMAHSLENFTTVLELLNVYEPSVIRLYLLSQQYRHPVSFSREALDERVQAMERLVATRETLRSLLKIAQTANRSESTATDRSSAASMLHGAVDEMKDGFYRAMDDDFNTASALAGMFTFAKAVNRFRDEVNSDSSIITGSESAIREGDEAFERLLGILGLKLPARGEATVPSLDSTSIADVEIERMLRERAELRQARRFAESDAVRASLEARGVTIEDHVGGTTWRRVR